MESEEGRNEEVKEGGEEIDLEELEEAEIRSVVRKMKKKKATGIDGISMEA